MSPAIDQKSNASEGLDAKRYWEHYGLSFDPFASEVDLNAYYALPRWEEHIDLLQYLCHYNNVLALVLGVSGIGKSMLMAQLASQVEDTMTVAAVQADPAFDIQRLAEVFATGLGAPWQPELSVDQQLEEQLQAIQSQDRICLLLVDDAHLLPNETLAALLDMLHQQSETQMRLHVVLFGEPQLHDHLTQLCDEEDDSLLHALSLDALSFEETERYLAHRLQVAGWEETLPFGQEALIRIYRLAEGIPARINRIARRMLFEALSRRYQAEESSVGFFETYKTKILGAVVVILFGVLTMFSVNLFSHKPVSRTKTVMAFQDQSQDAQRVTPVPAPAAAPIPPSNTLIPAADAVPSPSNVTSGNETAVVLPVSGNRQVVPAVPEPVSTPMPVSSSSGAQTTSPLPAAVVSVQSPTATSVVESATTVPVASAPSAVVLPTAPTSTANMQPAVVAVPPMPIAAPVPSPIATSSPVVSSVAKTPSSSTVAPKVLLTTAPIQSVASPIAPSGASSVHPEMTSDAAPIASAEHAALSHASAKKKHADKGLTSHEEGGRYSAADQWFMSQPDDHFTVQLVGLSHELAVKQFIARNDLDHRARYFRTALHGKPFFVLLYGNYPNKQAAIHAIAGFPAALRAYTPWPRSFASVKRSLNRRTS